MAVERRSVEQTSRLSTGGAAPLALAVCDHDQAFAAWCWLPLRRRSRACYAAIRAAIACAQAASPCRTSRGCSYPEQAGFAARSSAAVRPPPPYAK